MIAWLLNCAPPPNPSMNGSTETINLLLIDDHEMFREGLWPEALRERRGSDWWRSAQRHRMPLHSSPPRASRSTVLLDVDLGKRRGVEFVEAARRAGFKSPILVLTAGISGQEAV